MDNQRYLSQSEAQKIIGKHRYKITSIQAYLRFVQESPRLNLPAEPKLIYKSEWRGWGNFLGIPILPPAHETKKELLAKFINDNNLFTYTLYLEARSKLPKTERTCYPGKPERLFGGSDGRFSSILWAFLSEGFYIERSLFERSLAATRSRLSYAETREIISRQAGCFNSSRSYRAFVRENPHLGLPPNPAVYFGASWRGWGEFLSAAQKIDFSEIERLIISYKIRTTAMWKKLRSEGKIPAEAPANIGGYILDNFSHKTPCFEALAERLLGDEGFYDYQTLKAKIEQAAEGGRLITSRPEYLAWVRGEIDPRIPSLPNEIYGSRQHDWIWQRERGWASLLRLPREMAARGRLRESGGRSENQLFLDLKSLQMLFSRSAPPRSKAELSAFIENYNSAIAPEDPRIPLDPLAYYQKSGGRPLSLEALMAASFMPRPTAAERSRSTTAERSHSTAAEHSRSPTRAGASFQDRQAASRKKSELAGGAADGLKIGQLPGFERRILKADGSERSETSKESAHHADR